MSSFSHHEAVLIGVTNEIQGDFESDLQAVGLVMHPARIEVRNPDQASYTSELIADFTSGDELADRFEFLVFRNGELIVTADELRTWLRSQLAEIIEGRS